ncbi:MAG: hypothetical protein HY717_14990 [Planctomycetes bacterium]|nr:hypothetical protein [Planctomycetota bacterium]
MKNAKNNIPAPGKQAFVPVFIDSPRTNEGIQPLQPVFAVLLGFSTLFDPSLNRECGGITGCSLPAGLRILLP